MKSEPTNKIARDANKQKLLAVHHEVLKSKPIICTHFPETSQTFATMTSCSIKKESEPRHNDIMHPSKWNQNHVTIESRTRETDLRNESKKEKKFQIGKCKSIVCLSWGWAQCQSGDGVGKKNVFTPQKSAIRVRKCKSIVLGAVLC